MYPGKTTRMKEKHGSLKRISMLFLCLGTVNQAFFSLPCRTENDWRNQGNEQLETAHGSCPSDFSGGRHDTLCTKGSEDGGKIIQESRMR